MTKTNEKTPKTSVVKQAACTAAMCLALIIVNIFDLIRTLPGSGTEDYIVSSILSAITLLLMIGLLALTKAQTKNPEKNDELSMFHRYKAGYISKYVLAVAVIVAIWIIKDFHFAFTGDFIGNLMNLPLIIFVFGEFVENITFIILEKRGLE